jgi:Protein of unknown function (DUF2934)
VNFTKEASMSDFEQTVRVRAYELWEIAGRPNERSDEFWLIAEAELKPQEESAAKPPASPPSDIPSVPQRGAPSRPIAAAA